MLLAYGRAGWCMRKGAVVTHSQVTILFGGYLNGEFQGSCAIYSDTVSKVREVFLISGGISLCSHQFFSLVLFVASSIMATGGEPGTSQFALLMDEIRKVDANVEKKLSGIICELSEEREPADERLVKKLSLDSKPSFRKKGTVFL